MRFNYVIGCIALLCTVLLSLNFQCGNPPGNPAPAPKPTYDSSSTHGDFTVKADTIGPPKWHYTVKFSNFNIDSSATIKSVELISSTQALCKVDIDPADKNNWSQDTTSATYLLKSGPALAFELKFSITCDAKNGPVYLKVTGWNKGTETSVLGPVAGPVQ